MNAVGSAGTLIQGSITNVALYTGVTMCDHVRMCAIICSHTRTHIKAACYNHSWLLSWKMTLRTLVKSTITSYFVEFEDRTASVVEGSQLDCPQPQIGSVVTVNNKYTGTVIAHGK